MSLHLLIVEDSPGDAALLRKALDKAENLDQNNQCVETLSLAQTALGNERFDCILLDLGLTDAEGFSGLIELRSTHEDTPVIVLTGADTRETGAEAITLGAQDYLNKNWISPELVERSIRYAIERHRQQIALKMANAELDRFATAIAHDLKTPITAIQGFASLLQQRGQEFDETTRKFIEHIIDATKRIDAMISDLLNYGRQLSTGEANGEVGLDAVFEWALEGLVNETQQTKATLNVHPLPKVWANEAALRQLSLSLVDNALKYRGDDPPVIDVHAEQNEDSWTIEVSDNGIGIPPAERERVLQPGVRLRASDVAGTGLGLANCAAIIRQHGGTIRIADSALGGTSVIFTLPASHQ